MSHSSIPHLHQFLEMIATEKKATRSTLSAFDTDLNNFAHFLNDQAFEQVDSQNIQHYLLTQQHLAPSTIARRLSSLRQFYAFLLSKGMMKQNPLEGIPAILYKAKPISLITEDDLTHLLEGAKTWSGPEGKRLSLLLQILYTSNISVNDLVALPLAAERNALQKLDAFREYMAVRYFFLEQQKESPWLFPSSSQKGHLTRQRFGQLLKELVLRVGLNPARFSLSTIRQGLDSIKK